ncbi:MAG TPA: PEP/pyruvate-binding domain-containing protein, partial [Candidatus Thermoplasmatota archaeon]|nr:PEP/pyruvate-binding domain-containing protein [Candidatus Thermoplasmatota archaeon]
MENNNFAEFLKDISQQDLSKVGGKAANLGEMIRAGLPVPEGFVLVVDAYEKFIEFNKIKIRIEQLLMNLKTNELEDIEKVSREIKSLFEDGEIPADLLYEIYDFYEKMGSFEVVVRSSSTLEDSPTTSFAGQYDSFLNVKGKKQLQESIKNCWASLWNTRALSYRLKQKIDSTELAHAVIVQKQIIAEKSGILFTANPLNNRRDQMLINSSWGLGEAIVSGDVTPDQWIIHKKSHEIIEEKIAVKDVMTIRKNEGTKLVDVPREKVKQPSLEKSEIHNLLKLGRTTEYHFNRPQDIEWSVYTNKIYLVQSRPITTLFPNLKPEDKSEELRIYTNFLLIDKVMPEPLTPMGRELWMKTLTNLFPNQLVKHAGGRIFVDTTELSRLEKWWDKLRSNPSAMDPETIKTTLEVLERNKNQLKKQRKSIIKIIPNMILGINPSFYKFLLTSSLKVQYGMLFSPEKVVKKAHIFGENQIKSLEEKSKKLDTVEEKLEFIEQNILAVLYFIPLQTLFYVVNSLTYLEKAKTIIRKYLDDTSQLRNVEKSLPNNVTTEMGMDLLRIARKIDQSGEH